MKLMSLADVGETLQICPRNARKWLNENNVPTIPVGKSLRWSCDDIFSALERGKIKPLAKEYTPRKTHRSFPITGKSNSEVLQSLGI